MQRSRKSITFPPKWTGVVKLSRPQSSKGLHILFQWTTMGRGYKKRGDGKKGSTKMQENHIFERYGQIFFIFKSENWQGNKCLKSTPKNIPLPMSLNDATHRKGLYVHTVYTLQYSCYRSISVDEQSPTRRRESYGRVNFQTSCLLESFQFQIKMER